MHSQSQESSRFGDSSYESRSVNSFLKSGLVENQVTLFKGVDVNSRMDKIRNSIEYVRKNWDCFDEFMGNLSNLFSKDSKDNSELLSNLLSNRRDWIDRPFQNSIDANEDNYDALRLYTSRGGYDEIFYVMNLAFRSNTSSFYEIVNSIVFLVELLNIDLYNYNERNQGVSVFSSDDVVYRGLCLERGDIDIYLNIHEKPIVQRYVSIPMGFWSCSLNRREAESFIVQKLQKESSLFPLIWKIRIISLDDGLLRKYHDYFPNSIVSPICATRIYGLSNYPEEREVLLRGPFFQILDSYQEGEILGKPVRIVEAVMLDSNRDHPSTAELGEKDGPARDLFRNIVGLTRNRFCADYYRKKDNVSAAQEKSIASYQEEFRKGLEKHEQILQSL